MSNNASLTEAQVEKLEEMKINSDGAAMYVANQLLELNVVFSGQIAAQIQHAIESRSENRSNRNTIKAVEILEDGGGELLNELLYETLEENFIKYDFTPREA